MTVRIAMTIATIGRRMKNWAIRASPSVALGLWRRGRGGAALVDLDGLGLDLDAGPYLLQSLDHDPLAGLEARVDDPERADALRRLHHADLDRVVAAHDR